MRDNIFHALEKLDVVVVKATYVHHMDKIHQLPDEEARQKAKRTEEQAQRDAKILSASKEQEKSKAEVSTAKVCNPSILIASELNQLVSRFRRRSQRKLEDPHRRSKRFPKRCSRYAHNPFAWTFI